MRNTDSTLIDDRSISPGDAPFETFRARLALKDRTNVDRHIVACERDADHRHSNLWKRLAAMLSALSPRGVQAKAGCSLQFFVPDGAYNLQVFALEDPGSDRLVVYATDARAQAIESGLLLGPVGPDGETRLYPLADHRSFSLEIESLTARDTTSAPEFYRHMLGWNRKAVKITLSLHAHPACVQALETFCALSSQSAIAKPPAAK